MSRTVRVVGGVCTAVALLVVLAFAYLQPGQSLRSAPSTTPSTGSSTTSTPLSGDPDGLVWVEQADLPPEARRTIALIDDGGPFPNAKDGSTFNNFEGLLPTQPRGYYREYTVPTPGEQDRGARRIVTGDDDRELFYTADHYASFVRVRR